MKVLVRCPDLPIAARPARNVSVGRKPPSNQPQERPAWFSSSPMLVPAMATASRVEQSSQYGWASLVREKPPLPSGVMSPSGEDEVETGGSFTMCEVSTFPVSPDATLIAPGEDGPKVDPYELSLIAKCWA